MRIQISSRWFPTLAVAIGLFLAARAVPAQDTATPAPASAATSQVTPSLSYGVSEVVQLSQAKVGDSTIINYIHNSGSSYGLDANQIIYLKQQGVSDAVINTMLNQPRMTQTVPLPATVATAPPPPVYVQPAASVPSSSVYVIPDTQTYNYDAYSYVPYSYGYSYPYCAPVYYGGYLPGVAISLGFGGHWGGYYHGGYGGWHGGYGGWHGGFRGGWRH